MAEVDLGSRPYAGELVQNMTKKINVLLGKNHALTVKQIPRDQVFKKKSVFWELSYSEILRHCIDVMHVEKKVCERFLGTQLKTKGKTKDGDGARLDMLDDQPKCKNEAEDGNKFLHAH